MNTFKEGKGLVSLLEAKTLIREWLRPIEAFEEVIPSAESLGRVLVESVYADEDLPSFRKATMDGYALNTETVSQGMAFQVIGERLMGTDQDFELEAHQAIYVPTGGKMPDNALWQMKVEGICLNGETLTIDNAAHCGKHWIERGEDIQKGNLALEKGTQIGPMSLGFLSLLGKEEVRVLKQLKIGIITTGDELVPSFAPASSGKIRDINQIVLKSLAMRLGATVDYAVQVKDDSAAIERAIVEGIAKVDFLMTSGASSMGKADVIPELLEKLSDEGLIFHGLNIKPGKPVGLVKINQKPVIALPGNPVSSAMTFMVVAEEIMRVLTGHHLERVKVNGILEKSCASQEGKKTFIPVKLKRAYGDLMVEPIMGKSGLISILSIADGFISVEPNEQLEVGTIVEITLF